jgi:hypothetical protein
MSMLVGVVTSTWDLAGPVEGVKAARGGSAGAGGFGVVLGVLDLALVCMWVRDDRMR